jgi:putative SOS response-associated peptidase YedK
MCGRYVTVSAIKTVEKRFDAVAVNPEHFTPNTNVGAGALAPVITSAHPREVHFFQFGFTPAWAKKNMYVLNARAEGDRNKANDPLYTGSNDIVSKPMFRQAIRSQRCLVIADAFIEGPEVEKLSKPYVVYLRNKQRPFAMAGIYDHWQHPQSGEAVHSFAIITTVANAVLQKIGHHRSPVILPREFEKRWLDLNLSIAEVTAMLGPYPAEEMNAYPIDAAIKRPNANGLSLLDPIGERLFPETESSFSQHVKLQGMGRRR